MIRRIVIWGGALVIFLGVTFFTFASLEGASARQAFRLTGRCIQVIEAERGREPLDSECREHWQRHEAAQNQRYLYSAGAGGGSAALYFGLATLVFFWRGPGKAPETDEA